MYIRKEKKEMECRSLEVPWRLIGFFVKFGVLNHIVSSQDSGYHLLWSVATDMDCLENRKTIHLFLELLTRFPGLTELNRPVFFTHGATTISL